jgi:hypothetical protein
VASCKDGDADAKLLGQAGKWLLTYAGY